MRRTRCAPGIMDVLNEWGPEGGTMEKITAAADDAEKERLMRGYLATLKNTDQVVKRWTLDAKYALDHLPKSGAAGALCREAGSVAPRRRRPLDGRRRRRAVLRRGSPLQGGAQPRRHPAVRHDDRYADAGAVPDGVFGPRRAAPAPATSFIGARHRSTTASTSRTRCTSTSPT